MIHSYRTPPSLHPLPPIPLLNSLSPACVLSFAPCSISTHLPPSLSCKSKREKEKKKKTSGDGSCRFPTSRWAANIHPKEQHIAVTHDDIMTTWKLINSFIQPKLLLLFISITVPHPSRCLSFLFLSYLSQIHPSAPQFLAVAGVTHKSLLLSNAFHFPRNTGRLLQKLGQA